MAEFGVYLHAAAILLGICGFLSIYALLMMAQLYTAEMLNDFKKDQE